MHAPGHTAYNVPRVAAALHVLGNPTAGIHHCCSLVGGHLVFQACSMPSQIHSVFPSFSPASKSESSNDLAASAAAGALGPARDLGP
jgi:hypothetical protein